MIDAVAGSTQISPAPKPSPSLQLTSSLPIRNNAIRLVEGETLTIDITGTDPVTAKDLVVGIYQNGYTQSNQTSLNLPVGASLKFTGADLYNRRAQFVWSPATGSAAVIPKLTLVFAATNNFYATTTKQTVTINLDDNQAPSFDEAQMSQLPPTITVDHPVKLPITVNADPDNDNVQIFASSLPKGAKISPVVANAGGQWVAHLNWTPNLDHLGKNYALNFYAKDDKVNPQQTSYSINLAVTSAAPPTFDPSLLAAQTFIVGKLNSYKVIVNADSYSKKVSITTDSILPKGANLSAAKKVNGQWVANLKWKPSAKQIGDYPLTFSAHDPAADSSLTTAPLFTTTLSVVNQ